MKYIFPLFTFFLLLSACTNDMTESKQELQTGAWHLIFDLTEADLTLNAAIMKDDKGYSLLVKNAGEVITADEFTVKGDSLTIKMPGFETELRGVFTEDSIQGVMQDYSRGENYLIPFVGRKGEIACKEIQTTDYSGRWAVHFANGKTIDRTSAPNAIGIFEQKGNQITGTFLTETGDYRFLEGCVTEKGFTLNTFDGSHVFYFSAEVIKETYQWELKGSFFSGNHYQDEWYAIRDDSVTLRDADALTFLNPGYDRLAFSFPDLQGDSLSLDDPRFEDKVVIVQILGSWCPNCMDESRLYAQWYDRYREQGLEIIGLAFERHAEHERAAQAVSRMADRLGVKYPLLIAGRASKKEAAEKLPMLNHVLSFPTSIFIDKTGKVRKIHTGFNGPGTGHLYDEFVEEYEGMLGEMLAE